MTGKSLRRNVWITIAALLLASAITLFVGIQAPKLGEASRAAVTVYIAIGAGWLTFCLQRRVAYTNALRALWERLVETVQDTVEYTAQESRTSTQYHQISKNLCCRIDEVRGVFRNVGEIYRKPTAETGALVRSIKHAKRVDDLRAIVDRYVPDPRRGLYPFESLKQIHNVVGKLGYGKASPHQSQAAHDSVLTLWGILRAGILKELDRDHPEFPDTPYAQQSQAAAVRMDVAAAQGVRPKDH